MTTPVRSDPPGARGFRLVGLLFLVLGVTVVLVVDVDGDPATTNVTSVVLAVEPSVPAEDDAERATTESRTKPGARACAAVTSLLDAWSEAAQHRWHRRVRPIRGP